MSWFRRLGFARRMLFVILGLSLAATGTILGVSFAQLDAIANSALLANANLGQTAALRSREALVSRIEEDLSLLASSQANFYNETLARIRYDVESMANFFTELYANPDYFTGELPPQPGIGPIAQFHLPPTVVEDAKVAADRETISNAYWLFQKVLFANPALSAVYVGTEQGWMFRFMEPTVLDPNYDPRLRPWYREALLRSDDNQVHWTGIYVDAFTGNLINSAVLAFNGPDGQPAGVVGVDMKLEYIIEDLTALRIGESSFSFLINSDDSVIADTRFDVNSPTVLPDPLKSLIELPVFDTGQAQVHLTTIGLRPYYVALAPLPASGWVLGIAVSYDEIMAEAAAMDEDINAQSTATISAIETQIQQTLAIFAVLLFIVFGLIVATAIWASKALARPLLALAAGATAVGAGELNTQIPIETADEIGMVATSFNQMTTDLKSHITKLAEAVEEQTRISSDLAIATEIQNDILPQVSPPFSGRKDLDISALMQPAKEVGGDFYDFFFIDPDQTKIALVIADVSGKSVPAALLMVIAKTLIKNNSDLSPAEILRTVNSILCEDNYSSMFVTAFYSVLDLATGEFTCANAGHTKPLIYRSQTNTVAFIDLPNALPLGVLPGKSYQQLSLTLKPGDSVLLYTDGVSEAFNPEQQLFGTERLTEDLLQVVDKPAPEVVDRIRAAVHSFANGEPQSDDIALLYVRYLASRE